MIHLCWNLVSNCCCYLALRNCSVRSDRFGEVVAVAAASVTDMGTDKSVEMFGNYAQKAKVIRLSEPIAVDWSYLTIDDDVTHYALNTSRVPLQNATLIVGETE